MKTLADIVGNPERRASANMMVVRDLLSQAAFIAGQAGFDSIAESADALSVIADRQVEQLFLDGDFQV